MKSTIQIISELEQMERVQWGHYSAPELCTKDARLKLEELEFVVERKEQLIRDWESECRKAREEVNRLKQERTATVNQQLTVRPEPSRLEIAAIIMQGLAARKQYVQLTDSNYALSVADYLIAAAKEAK